MVVKRNRRNRAVRAGNGGQLARLSTRGPAQQRTNVFKVRARRRVNNNNRSMIPRLSEAGIAFLKCAFASPDFTVDPGKGIPDQFHGRTLSIKDCFTTALSFTAGTDTYLVFAPIPGYAYFRSNVAIGTDPGSFVGVPFPTFDSNFGPSGTDAQNNYSKFRYASLAAGLYPTSNLMQFSGSIQVWRVDLNLAENLDNIYSTAAGTSGQGAVVSKRLQGISGIVPLAPRDNYSENFIKGAYTFAFDKSQDFTWQDFCCGPQYAQQFTIPASGAPAPTGKYLQFDGTRRLTGLGNVNTIVMKISTPTAAVNTALLRVWNCIELQPDVNSALFQFSGVSPAHDPLALELYHRVKMNFPVAVPVAENGKFWETVLRAIEHVSRIGMLLPGPLGVISGGVNTIATGIQGFY